MEDFLPYQVFLLQKLLFIRNKAKNELFFIMVNSNQSLQCNTNVLFKKNVNLFCILFSIPFTEKLDSVVVVSDTF